jgi:hypothetical protein
MLHQLMSKIYKKFIKNYKLSDTEALIKSVLELMLQTNGTEAITAPISERYYVSNPKVGYYIKVTEYSITITNHKFTFQEAITEKFKKIILDIIKQYMEESRSVFENTVFDNQIELLKNIKSNLLKKQSN